MRARGGAVAEAEERRGRWVSARGLGRVLGISHNAVLGLYRAGVISAEIHEGALMRFDPLRVREVLRARAVAHQDEISGGGLSPRVAEVLLPTLRNLR
jgi:hypothetical protein